MDFLTEQNCFDDFRSGKESLKLKSVRTNFHAGRTKSQGGVQKSRFSSFCDFAKKKNVLTGSGCGQLQSDSAPFKESGDTRFLNVRHTVWEF